MLAGIVFGLASLTRSDGLVLSAFAGLWLVWDARPRIAPSVAFAVSVLALLAPYLGWMLVNRELLFDASRLAPVTIAWWAPGLAGLAGYFGTYAALALGLALGLAALGRDRVTAVVSRVAAAPPDGTVPHARDAAPGRRQLELALALSLGLTLYAARVGAVDTLARLLVPVAPLMLLAMEVGIERLVPPRLPLRAAAAVTALAALALARSPYLSSRELRGIVDADLRQYTIERVSLEAPRAASGATRGSRVARLDPVLGLPALPHEELA